MGGISLISWEPCVAEISESWFQGTFLQPTTFRGFEEPNPTFVKNKNKTKKRKTIIIIIIIIIITTTQPRNPAPAPPFLVPRSEQRFDGKQVFVRIVRIGLLEKQVEHSIHNI